MRHAHSRRSLLKRAAGAVALAAVTLQPAYADGAAEAFVQGILDEAEPILSEPNSDAFYSGIENLVTQYVDMRRIGLFVLGQYARQLTDAQKEEYFPLFQQYATLIYRNTLSDYGGQRIIVTGSIDRSESNIIVN